MSVTPALPLLKRVPPSAWTALAWCVSVAYPTVVLGGTPDRSLSHAGGTAGHRDWALLGAASLIAFSAAALLNRRPLLSIALLTVATLAATDATRSNVQLPLTALLSVDVALCLVTAAQPRRTSRAALAMVLVVLFLHLGLTPANTFGLTTATYDGAPAPGTLFVVDHFQVTTSLPHIGVSDEGVLAAVIAWLVGRSIRQSREHTEMLSTQLAAQAVTAERLRIAREMHDTVAHSIGIVALQAGAARRVIDSRPDRARDALTEIETAGRETLSGLRRMLGALRRAEQDAGAGTTASRRPPGLADLDRLAAATTAAGVRVDVRWRGERRPLRPEVGLAVFRIVQESVANVVRHAETTSCQVSIDCRTGDEVAVEITDRGGSHGATPGSGYGLAGLRERVALLHGEFHAGPRTGGGFRVSARLPTVGEAP
ncbi:sensor histidine kinase [Streptomyces sp. NBC_01387]|uniref:sensor histidine kinase n=1 Tax=unclassified Streptomyces TaxID=2593676 RepID=UPI002024709F|nr:MULTISPECIES: sensor histidine kinase [unclassified Streptomyces]MCX4552996.1 sensor histidine kinase [Streptomyces sp. NBC_01500]WSC24317.1 sensor histidine kinase [Streptomyces sp. NBC_01766]